MMHYSYGMSLLNNTMLDIGIRYPILIKEFKRVESIKRMRYMLCTPEGNGSNVSYSRIMYARHIASKNMNRYQF